MAEKLTQKDYELINSYLDQELDRKGVLQFAERMSEDPAIRGEVEDLMKVKSMIRELPTVTPPRNYILTRAMAEEARPRPFWERLLPFFRTAAAFCALALVFTFVFPLMTNNRSAEKAAEGTVNQTMYAAKSVPLMESMEEEAAEAPLFRDEEIVLNESYSGDSNSYAAVMPSYGVRGGNPRIEYMLRMEEKQAGTQNAAPLDPDNPPEGFVSVETLDRTKRDILIRVGLGAGLVLSVAGAFLLSRRKKAMEVN